jgi:aryl-alcohol dehydrogenase-like predicted oxidoreductase
MEYTILPNSDLKVSRVCLGTMTFGEQNTAFDAQQQLDFAVSKGINFIDTAEMYPIAARMETLGFTEKYIGDWLQKRGKRDDLVIATKIAGPNRGMEYIRKPLNFEPQNIIAAVDGSLKNLNTDYIDLYQLHWPERHMNMFGKRGVQDADKLWEDSFHSVLATIQMLIKSGKIRYFGLSNENPFGVMRCIEEHKLNGLPRIISIQNPFSLLNRLFEVGLSEMCLRESVSLLAYSPLGFGFLSGKHLNGFVKDSRLDKFRQFTRYTNTRCFEATTAYQNLAHKHGLTLTQMALAFVNQQSFVGSTIIGATSIEQLSENIDAFTHSLSVEVLEAIERIHESVPNPAP